METVEVVIRIPKDDYDYMKEYRNIRSFCEKYIANQIISGTILPKGHGRLVDADAITKHVEIFKQSFVINYDQLTGKSSIVCTAPTIIEADRGDDNG